MEMWGANGASTVEMQTKIVSINYPVIRFTYLICVMASGATL